MWSGELFSSVSNLDFSNDMKIAEILRHLEGEFPLAFQDSFDHSGLQVGDVQKELTGILLGVDVTEELLEEAVRKGANLIVTHHPLLFHPLKEVTPASYVERCTTFAIKHDLVLYAVHTNLDNAPGGLNRYWAERVGLSETSLRAIRPLSDFHYKLNVFAPIGSADVIRQALREAGAGRQGDYEGCSFSHQGVGRFAALPGAQPFVGEVGEWHEEPEEMISTLLPKHLVPSAVNAMLRVHPYEEPAYEVMPVTHTDPLLGAGIVGELEEAVPIEAFLDRLKSWQTASPISVSPVLHKEVKRIAYCGGSGAFLLKDAARLGADLFITGEAKYNDFHDARDLTTLAVMGHFETEWFAVEVLEKVLSEKNGNFAVHRALEQMNPIRYYI